jgi:hypothetical protein
MDDRLSYKIIPNADYDISHSYKTSFATDLQKSKEKFTRIRTRAITPMAVYTNSVSQRKNFHYVL